ncbi:MAG: calcineurin-like phosphoesterase family protein, partial [Longimicrobiales bacterium]|nr:calcineurin-like phosphoesterase family protein [Longimicrobiales bacterium]
FVFLSVPDGYEIPCSGTGTARFYHRLAPGGGEDRSVAFDLAEDPRPAERHAMLVLADPQTQNAADMARFHAETVPDVRATVAGLAGPVAFGVACGDIVYDDLSLFPDYERAVAAMGVPFFQVVGNHDLDLGATTDETSTRTFSRHFGPRWYSFDRGAVHYVVLDDVHWHGRGYLGYLDAAQLAWLAADLATVEPGRTVIAAIHIPPLGAAQLRPGDDAPHIAESVTNREALYRLLEPFRAHVVAGHMHETGHAFAHGVHEHVCGAVCGAWWTGPICWDGTPNGYAVYEVSGESVTWRYKATGHDADHQLVLYP